MYYNVTQSLRQAAADGRTQGDDMSAAQAHEFYADPEHLAASGPGRRREGPMKSGVIPVRFAPDVIDAVKHFAAQDGVTVSTWIRRLVGSEIQRRQPPATAVASVVPSVELKYNEAIRPESETGSRINPNRLVAIAGG
jgi:hypothetical protein